MSAQTVKSDGASEAEASLQAPPPLVGEDLPSQPRVFDAESAIVAAEAAE